MTIIASLDPQTGDTPNANPQVRGYFCIDFFRVKYLAAGRPVITQETGFSHILPTGEGLFSFATTDDIMTAIDVIESDYHRHCRSARDLATEYFSADHVLASLTQRAGL